MANTVNVSNVSTSNTFDQWRISTNLLTDDVNEITRGNFSKPRGNVTINQGYLLLANTSGGVLLEVKANARVDGLFSVDTIESDADGHVYLAAGDITMGNRAAGGLYQANINTFFNSANVSISNVTVGGTFNVASNTLITASNVVISNTQVGGTLNVASNTFITASNVVISNTQAGGTLNVASNTTISAQKVNVTNTTADARFNVSPNTYFFGGHVNVANTAGVATFEVTPNVFFWASANVSGNVNVLSRLEVTGNANLYSNLGVTWNTFTGNAVVAQNTQTGNLAVTQNTTTGNIVVSQNSSTGNLVVSQNSNTGNLVVLTLANIATGNVVTLYNNTMYGNLVIGLNGLINVQSNLNVSGLLTSTNVRVLQFANIANANVASAYIDFLTVGNPIVAPAATNSNGYIVRFGLSTDGDAFFRVQRSVASGNADLFWDDSVDSWRLLANNIPAPLIAGNTTVTLKSYREVSVNSTANGATTVDLSTSNWFRYTLNGSSTFTFANAPASGNVFTVNMLLVQGTGGGKTVSWGNTIYWAGGQIPPATTAAAGNTDLWTLTTYDGGSTFLGTLTIKDAR